LRKLAAPRSPRFNRRRRVLSSWTRTRRWSGRGGRPVLPRSQFHSSDLI